MLEFNLPLLLVIPVGLAVLIAVAARPPLVRFVLAGALFAAALGQAVDMMGEPFPSMWSAVLTRRSQMYLAAGGLLFLTALYLSTRRIRPHIGGPGLVLLLIGVYGGLLRLFHPGASPLDGPATIAFVGLTSLPIAMISSQLFDIESDWYWPFRALLAANALWIGMVAVQFFVNPSQLVVPASARFYGVSANPQHAAVFLSVCSLVAVMLVLHDDRRLFRPVWIGLLAINVALIAWTGSRTGLLMTTIGSMILARKQLGRFLFVLPVVAVFAYIALQLLLSAGAESTSFSRLGSLENTRAHAWLLLFQNGINNPFIGVGLAGAQESENSYLLGFAAYGLGMVVLLGFLLIVSAVQGFQLFRLRRMLGPAAPLADLVLAFYLVYFLGALVEGYIMARVSASLVFFLFFSALGVQLIRVARERMAAVGVESAGATVWGPAPLPA